MLPDDVFLEIFAFRTLAPTKSYSGDMRQWQSLAQVCNRWRQIICASPSYLGLLLYCSEGNAGKSLSYWPTIPIAMCYYIPDNEDDAIALLKHSDPVKNASNGIEFDIAITNLMETLLILSKN